MNEQSEVLVITRGGRLSYVVSEYQCLFEAKVTIGKVRHLLKGAQKLGTEILVVQHDGQTPPLNHRVWHR